ncbi:autophagy-related protein 9 [Dunaliella salina]|uniref:Autophagy-related protein 9 n=1 Tax=Dunaliella salina TaxID=3046 RepID=A0ABQ7GIQ9_DUNSA|nr:autophagy-related protein 9 [Dunaliella salina]|eukprot:KAF5834471.1 autophagy-related protein 9 [Dunaliella salina]
MFDDQFCVKRSFLEKPEMLKKRFRTAALINAALSPFLLLFLLLYFFMRNAEHFYHHPGAAGSRRWSALARWRLRELNELPHYCSHRLDAAHAPACHYCAQASVD